MTKNLVWRLQEKPTTKDITRLIEAGVITKQEAKDVFFREDDKPKKTTSSEIDDIRREVELLREVVLALASNRPAETVIYKYIDSWKYKWTQPYVTYCGANLPSDYTPIVSYGTYTSASNSLLK